ncbi:hypothetical protein BN961_00713 [Afipia felis]|uniref:Uncharacterized protein n=1 Tax=Afipia felis TaxID=1035 RepID=A0A090MNU2_AFIFE|nr:hypothetical protein BN961_00713 [Afipia felis]
MCQCVRPSAVPGFCVLYSKENGMGNRNDPLQAGHFRNGNKRAFSFNHASGAVQ